VFAQRVVGSWAVAYLLVDVDDNIVAAVRHGVMLELSVSSYGQIALDVASPN
jgi:hypothetical protein